MFEACMISIISAYQSTDVWLNKNGRNNTTTKKMKSFRSLRLSTTPSDFIRY